MVTVILHTVFITYNRLELTKRAVESYLDTLSLPAQVSIVDNASSDGTQDWINENSTLFHGIHLLAENRYPGFAANLAWEHSWSDGHNTVTHLHRADNDFIFLPGWCEEVEERFKHGRKLGQLGLRTSKEENSTINVGGNCVFIRKLWDRGLRYDERPWPQIRDEVGAGWTEDSLMGSAVRNLGYSWGRVKRPCIQPIGRESKDDPYYQSTWADRGIE